MDQVIPAFVAPNLGLSYTPKYSLTLGRYLMKCQKGSSGRDLTTDHIFVIPQEHFLGSFSAESICCHANSVSVMAHNLESVHQGAFKFRLVLRKDLVLPLEDCADVSRRN